MHPTAKISLMPADGEPKATIDFSALSGGLTVEDLHALTDWLQAIARHMRNPSVHYPPENVDSGFGRPFEISDEKALIRIAAAGLTLDAARTMTDEELLRNLTIGRKTLAWIRAQGRGEVRSPELEE